MTPTAQVFLGVDVTLEVAWWVRPVRQLLWMAKVRRALDKINREHDDVWITEVGMAPDQQWIHVKMLVRGVTPDQNDQCQRRILGLVQAYLHEAGLGTASFNQL